MMKISNQRIIVTVMNSHNNKMVLYQILRGVNKIHTHYKLLTNTNPLMMRITSFSRRIKIDHQKITRIKAIRIVKITSKSHISLTIYNSRKDRMKKTFKYKKLLMMSSTKDSINKNKNISCKALSIHKKIITLLKISPISPSK